MILVKDIGTAEEAISRDEDVGSEKFASGEGV